MQYTLRQIPSAVDKALRLKAREEGRSLNRIAVEALARGAGVDHPIAINHDWDFAFGAWAQDPELDAALEDQRKIDTDLWT